MNVDSPRLARQLAFQHRRDRVSEIV